MTRDKKVPRDFDGDGRSDLVVYRPSDGTWYVNGITNVPFRIGATDLPLPVFGVQPQF